MKTNILKKASNFFALLFLIVLSSQAILFADEKIIQEEKMSFKKCLNVIKVSADKLSVSPEISDISDKKREAVFTLLDGTLTIICDGQKGSLTVSTK